MSSPRYPRAMHLSPVSFECVISRAATRGVAATAAHPTTSIPAAAEHPRRLGERRAGRHDVVHDDDARAPMAVRRAPRKHPRHCSDGRPGRGPAGPRCGARRVSSGSDFEARPPRDEVGHPVAAPAERGGRCRDGHDHDGPAPTMLAGRSRRAPGRATRETGAPVLLERSQDAGRDAVEGEPAPHRLAVDPAASAAPGAASRGSPVQSAVSGASQPAHSTGRRSASASASAVRTRSGSGVTHALPTRFRGARTALCALTIRRALVRRGRRHPARAARGEGAGTAASRAARGAAEQVSAASPAGSRAR